jgi:hypothetical protein
VSTMASKIKGQLQCIADDFSPLLREIPIETLQRASGILFVAPDYYYGDLSPEQKNRQIGIIKRYDRMFELVQLLFSGCPPDIQKEIQEADSALKKWLQFDTNWSVSLDRDANDGGFRNSLNDINALVKVFDSAPNAETILVPDTNILLEHIQPTDYARLSRAERFTILLLPTVLAELDTLKVNHRNESVRDKANAVIRTIKGWRSQGSLLTGITANKTITVRSVATEPKAAFFPSWLDKENYDDRIVASILQLSSECPNAEVFLVTGDINLQNKAEFASIDYMDKDQFGNA